MSDILLNQKTKDQIEAFISSPSHGLLLQGLRGSGKSTTLDWTAAKLLGIEEEQLITYPYLLKLTPNEKNVITIDMVRELNRFLSRTVPGSSNGVKRVVIIDDAESMPTVAQNALLKNLEEPPIDTVIMIATADPNRLLPTVRSRLTIIRLLKPSKTALREYLLSLGLEEVSADRAILISGGSVGTAVALASDSNHPLVEASITARKILSSNTYERLTMVNTLHKDPELVKSILTVMQQMARIALETAKGPQAKRWQRILYCSYTSEKYLRQKTNLRLTLTYLMVHL